MAVETVSWRRRHFPFNAEQTVNILGEIGPLFAMFIVNGLHGIAAGTWALIITTLLSLVVTLWVLGRPPIMPFIAGAVSVTFGALTLITGDAMWVQIKVTLFNALVAFLLWMGLRSGHNFFRFVFRKTFHYTEEGWHKLTRNAALFFLATAIANEAVRLGLPHSDYLPLIASSPASTSGSSSRSSSSCLSRPCSSGGRFGSCKSIVSPIPTPGRSSAIARESCAATILELELTNFGYPRRLG